MKIINKKDFKNKSLGVDHNPEVSVAMIAFNVDKYLAKAIESVISQNTNFSFELVIGEDCSTDKTRVIALEYQKKYPDIIRVLLPKKNQGLTPNSVFTQNSCKGKYIALLDGDDYWTDNNKLQLQYDFLERNHEFSAYAHQSQIVYDDVSGKDTLFGSKKKEIYTVIDTIQHRKFHTSSLFYRRKYWIETGGIPINILSNERAIYPMLAIFGNIYYSERCMCIYRKSSIGISSRITYKELEMDLKMIPWLKNIDQNFPAYRFRSFLHLCIFSYPISISIIPLVKNYFLFLCYSFSYFPKNLGDVKYGTIEMYRIFKKYIFEKKRKIG